MFIALEKIIALQKIPEFCFDCSAVILISILCTYVESGFHFRGSYHQYYTKTRRNGVQFLDSQTLKT